jgi:hypothetical protein
MNNDTIGIGLLLLLCSVMLAGIITYTSNTQIGTAQDSQLYIQRQCRQNISYGECINTCLEEEWTLQHCTEYIREYNTSHYIVTIYPGSKNIINKNGK